MYNILENNKFSNKSECHVKLQTLWLEAHYQVPTQNHHWDNLLSDATTCIALPRYRLVLHSSIRIITIIISILSGLKVCNALISENFAEGLLEPFFSPGKSDHNVVVGAHRKEV